MFRGKTENLPRPSLPSPVLLAVSFHMHSHTRLPSSLPSPFTCRVSSSSLFTLISLPSTLMTPPSLLSFLPPDLSKPIDVYCEWIDECERISGEQEKVEGDEGEEEDV